MSSELVASFRPAAIVPCLDGEATVGSVVRGIKDSIADVIVVDDGSSDASSDAARDAGARVVRHPRNRGKGAALVTGLLAAEQAGATHAVTLDADGQHDPAELSRMLSVAAAEPAALVIGARDFSVPNVPSSSKFGRNFSNFWVHLETGVRVRDSQSGFRVYPVQQTLALRVSPSRFEWEVEVIVRAAWAGHPIRETDISVHYDPPEQRVSHYRKYMDSALISILHFRLVPLSMLRPLRRLFPVR